MIQFFPRVMKGLKYILRDLLQDNGGASYADTKSYHVSDPVDESGFQSNNDFSDDSHRREGGFGGK